MEYTTEPKGGGGLAVSLSRKPRVRGSTLRSAHLGMCLKTCSPGRPKPCEEIWVDDLKIAFAVRCNHWLYETLFPIGGGHMAPQPENPRNMSVGAETW